MSTAYYSTILPHSVHTVWSLIRDFNNYPQYIDGVSQSVIEDAKRGDEVGAVRRFLYGETWLRQQLVAHSDELRSLTYAGLEPFVFPPRKATGTPAPAEYRGSIRLLEVVDGDRTFIDWSVALDAAPRHADQWRDLLLELIPTWTESLRRALTRRAEPLPG